MPALLSGVKPAAASTGRKAEITRDEKECAFFLPLPSFCWQRAAVEAAAGSRRKTREGIEIESLFSFFPFFPGRPLDNYEC